MRSRSSATASQYQAGLAAARASKASYVAMSWRAMNRRRRERSRYAWLGVQAIASSLPVSDPVRSLITAPDMFDSDAPSRCANRPRDCCRRLAAGQVGAFRHHEPQCFGVTWERSMAWKRLFGKNRVTDGDAPAPTPELNDSGIVR